MDQLVITDQEILEFFDKNEYVDPVAFIKKYVRQANVSGILAPSSSQIPNPDVEASETVQFDKSAIKNMYTEYLSFVELREDLLTQNDEIMKTLKQFKFKNLTRECEKILQVEKDCYKCPHCEYFGYSKKSVPLHLRKCKGIPTANQEPVNEIMASETD